MRNFYHVCHGVGRRVIAGFFLFELGIKVNGNY